MFLINKLSVQVAGARAVADGGGLGLGVNDGLEREMVDFHFLERV